MINNNFARYHDMIFLLEEYFNNKRDHIKWVDLSCASEQQILFFYRKNNGESLMMGMLNGCIENMLGFDSLDVIQQRLLDYTKFINYVIDYYIPDREISFSTDSEFVRNINRSIAFSNYPNVLKSSLYFFIIDPIPVIQNLMYTLLNINSMLANMYENNLRILTSSYDELKEENYKKIQKIIPDFNDGKENFISLSLIDERVLYVKELDNKRIIILGGKYINSHTNNISTDQLEQFGHIISETNRLKLLDYISESGEITIVDVSKKLGLSGTNAYYHLSMMIKAGMININYKGRNAYYNMNSNYFRMVCDYLNRYIKQ